MANKIIPNFRPFGSEDPNDPHEMPQFMQELLQLGLKLILGLSFIALEWQGAFIFFTFWVLGKSFWPVIQNFYFSYTDDSKASKVGRDKILGVAFAVLTKLCIFWTQI